MREDCDTNSEILYQNILDSLPAGILFCDLNFVVRKINSYYAALLGGNIQSIIGRPLPDLNPGTRAPQVIKNGKPEMGDLCTLPLFGNQYKFVVNRIPVKDEAGKICGMISHILFTDPSELHELTKKIDYLSKKRKSYNKSLKPVHQAHYDVESIIGQSNAICEVKKLIQTYAQDTYPVLIQGYTGTGKELVAHALHAHSLRADAPFISINCAAIPKELFEAELFGYAQGAFSDARKGGKPGHIELADGGTLFLDEIGEMPMLAQVKLLRVLEDKSIMRLGDVNPKKVDFRLITATNRDLKDMIAKEQFREDLFYRISTLQIKLPPLRERKDDILLLAHNILRKTRSKITVFDKEAEKALLTYPWPGNVRQLFNVLVHASLHARDRIITVNDLPPEIANLPANALNPENSAHILSLGKWVEKQEAAYILQILQQNHSNITITAKQLGISRVTLYAKIKKYGILPL